VKEQSREYLTLTEVAERYRTTPATVRYWRHCGRGPRGVRIGTRVLYPLSEIERFDRELLASAGQAAAWPGR
jgi:predicted DNA-binding transcriptional regulator AlpA